MSTGLNAENAIFSPTRFTTVATQQLKQHEEEMTRAMPLPIPKMADYVAPISPGQTCSVVAQTSNFKTGFMRYWIKQYAKQLQTTGRQDEYIVVIDMETPIEDLAVMEIAEASGADRRTLDTEGVKDWSPVYDAIRKLNQTPVIRIGTTIGRDPETTVRWENLYIGNILEAIEDLVDGKVFEFKVKIAAIFVDYLQAFPLDPSNRRMSGSRDTRRIQVRNDFYNLREAASRLRAPMVIGCQAKQDLSNYWDSTLKIPGKYDVKETSDVAERTDRSISLLMCKEQYDAGTKVETPRFNFTARDNLLFTRVTKQRNGYPAGAIFPLEINYDTGALTSVRQSDLF